MEQEFGDRESKSFLGGLVQEGVGSWVKIEEVD